jgi:cyanophycin synthetase
MLAIRSSMVLGGPNIWAPLPVIVLEVTIGELEERLCRETPIFFDPLTDLIPSLRTYRDVVNQPEGGLRRLLLDRLALALQGLANARVAQLREDLAPGAELTIAQTHPTDIVGVYTVVYAYEHAAVGRAAGELAVRLLNHLLAKSEPDFELGRELETTVVPLAMQHAERWLTGAIVTAARRRGIPVERLRPYSGSGGDIVQLGNGAYQRRTVWGTMTSETPSLACEIQDDKGLTSRLLREAGLPVPQGAVVHAVEEAVKTAVTVGFPVVVKPVDATHGYGATLDVRDDTEVQEAFPIAKRQSRRGGVVVERFIPGRHYRILVIGNRVVAVRERVPAHVVGDGTSTVDQLIEVANQDPRRGLEPDQPLRPITLDAQTRAVLAKQELTLEAVPEAGRFVQLKPFGLPELGGADIDRTDEIHPDNAQIARQAAMVVGLDVAGIDLITPDIAHSAYEQGGAINEVNAQPGLHGHTHPTEGTPRDVAMAIVDHLFPPAQPVRVPIVAVTGTNGKTTTTRMLAHIMHTAGKTVGMTTTDGLYLAGTQVAVGDLAGAAPARTVLRNPAIDYAVLETARGSILFEGLGFDCCDVAVVTNVAADHLGTAGIETLEDLARIKAVVPRAVVPDGATVLNADDSLTAAMGRESGGEILYFSMDEENPVIHDHVERGGRAVVLRAREAEETLVLLTDGEETQILPATEIPATLEGRIRVNIANALAATAAAVAQDVPLETIRTALRTFANSITQTPGRFNVLEIDGRTVLIDYCHNLHGLEAMADFVQRMHAPHTVAVIAIPGDRRDEDITAFGRLAAQIFDELVVWDTPAEYRRGRDLGEVPGLLQAAAIAGGLAPDKISHSDDEQVAARMAIAKGRPDGLVVMLVGSGRSLVNLERS